MRVPRPSVVLVRYGEIGIKGPAVRRRFERLLVEELRAGLDRAGVEGSVDRTYGRIYVRTEEPMAAARVASRTFGVVSASPARTVEASPAAVAEALAEVSRGLVPENATFAVRARRTGSHGFSSMDVAREAGTAVLEAHEGRGVSVDLDDPDVELHVEVRDDTAYVFTTTLDGPGGLPRGSQGLVAAVVTRPRDVLAAWLLLRRGCDAVLVTPQDPGVEVAGAVDALQGWVPLDVVAVERDAGDPWHVAAEVARERGARALAVGDLLEEAASPREVELPVLRPLVGFRPGDLEELAERVGVPRVEGVVP